LIKAECIRMFQIADRRWLIAEVRKAFGCELRRISNQPSPIRNLEHPYKIQRYHSLRKRNRFAIRSRENDICLRQTNSRVATSLSQRLQHLSGLDVARARRVRAATVLRLSGPTATARSRQASGLAPFPTSTALPSISLRPGSKNRAGRQSCFCTD